MNLSLSSLQNRKEWEQAGFVLPKFDPAKIKENTLEKPMWIHFGVGNIFRGFVSSLQQNLLNRGLSDRGIIAAGIHDFENIDRIFDAYDNLAINVTLSPNGGPVSEVLASVSHAVRADFENASNWEEIKAFFRAPSLQMVSYTITEKGYALKTPQGEFTDTVKADMEQGPASPRHAMSITAALLYERYLENKAPISMVSMDNCAQNGTRLKNAVLTVAEAWAEKGFIEKGFIDYLNDESLVAFPWSMIDKITPRPSPAIADMLKEKGVENVELLVTKKNTFAAAFVNGEKPEYLVIEDKFPNGRPPLHEAGVYFCDKNTVSLSERMKVTTCLNPLHTTLAVYGCLLSYSFIWEETHDEALLKTIKRLGYQEGLPVVEDPGILSPEAFLNEVLTERLPNNYLPDTPQRIATDTSQKVGVRFGETLKRYQSLNMDMSALVSIPAALAGWMRYLLGVNDQGEEMEVSSDPLKETLQDALKTVVWNDPASYNGQLLPILKNASIFGLDLTETPLAEKIEAMFCEMLKGKGAVRTFIDRL